MPTLTEPFPAARACVADTVILSHDVSAQGRDDRGRFAGGSTAVRRTGKESFTPDGGDHLASEVHDRAVRLKIPPAWKDVRVANSPDSPLQAVGTDDKGRTQYLYSAAHRRTADATKFEKLKGLLDRLPEIEKKLAADLGSDDRRRSEPAGVLALIARTGFRVGGPKDKLVEGYRALGASTLTARNVKILGDDRVRFTFKGKHGVVQRQTIHDADLVRVLRPRVTSGGKLFDASAADVRDYLKEGKVGFTPKDFRTAVAAQASLRAMQKVRPPRDLGDLKRARQEVAVLVSKRLGNTPAVALKSYIPPEVFGAWEKRVQERTAKQSQDLSLKGVSRKKPPKDLAGAPEGSVVHYHPSIKAGRKARTLPAVVTGHDPQANAVRLRRIYGSGKRGPERQVPLEYVHHVHKGKTPRAEMAWTWHQVASWAGCVHFADADTVEFAPTPYVGPRGGKGWRLDSGRIVYGDLPAKHRTDVPTEDVTPPSPRDAGLAAPLDLSGIKAPKLGYYGPLAEQALDLLSRRAGVSGDDFRKLLVLAFGAPLDRPTRGDKPDNPTVIIGYHSIKDKLYVEVMSPGFRSEGYLDHRDGSVGLDLALFKILSTVPDGAGGKLPNPLRGQGVHLFVNMVRALRQLGGKKIECQAVGNSIIASLADGYNGYYTWPRYGFDGTIQERAFGHLPGDLQLRMGESRSVQDLFQLPGGQRAWKGHGADIDDAHFDLSDGSRSMRVLADYLEERRRRAGFAMPAERLGVSDSSKNTSAPPTWSWLATPVEAAFAAPPDWVRALIRRAVRWNGGVLHKGGVSLFAHPDTGRVWLCVGDWADTDGVRSATRELEDAYGADKVQTESEGLPPGHQGWWQVFPKYRPHGR